MLTIADLGILRSVEQTPDRVVVTITPTYSGCPAMREISHDVRHRVRAAGYRGEVEVRTRLSPAWTSDWITEAGRRKLADAGIAPPRATVERTGPIPLTLGTMRPVVACPVCGSVDTERRADFSATACKALYACRACREPFEYVKDI